MKKEFLDESGSYCLLTVTTTHSEFLLSREVLSILVQGSYSYSVIRPNSFVALTLTCLSSCCCTIMSASFHRINVF
jgi:hypothetical protein